MPLILGTKQGIIEQKTVLKTAISPTHICLIQ